MGPARRFAAYDGAILVLVTGLAAVTLLALLQPQSLTLTHSLLLNVAITTAALIVAFGAAYFAVTEFFLYGLTASLWIGLAFLLLAEANAGTGLLPVVAGWHAQLRFAQTGWALQRLIGALMLVAAALVGDRSAPSFIRRRWIARGVFVCSSVALVITGAVYVLGSRDVSPLAQRLLQLAAGGAFFAASALFWREARETRREWFLWLSLNLGIGGFAQLQYAVRPYSADVVQAGDVLRLVFFTGILLGLVAEWSRGFRILRTQTRELAVLHALMTAPSIRNVGDVVRHSTQIIGDALRADARLALADLRDASATTERLMEMVSARQKSGQPDVVQFDEGPGGKVGIAAPLDMGGRRLGTLIVSRLRNDRFTDQDIHLVRAFAAQASILLERSLLYEEVAAGAVLAERSRLAREIHDGLAQHLAFLKMRVAWLQRSPARVDVEQLQDIEGILATALAEARQAITTLRADVGATTTVDALVSYAEEFGRLSGLEVVIDRQEVPEVGPRARVELLRVVQEALNNVRKHAEATVVSLSVRRAEGGIEVSIQDNGTGFSADETPEGHFGVEIMRERAESIGGTLRVISEPGAGTQVDLLVPAGTNGSTEQRLTG